MDHVYRFSGRPSPGLAQVSALEEQAMLTPNVVTLNQITHYLVDYPKNKLETRKLVVAGGVCNGIPFEATAINDPDYSTSLDLFRADGGQFSKMEFQSVQRRIKMAPPQESIDLRDEPEAKGYEHFYDQMCEKYYGAKIYLRVPFSRKDDAKGLGAKWDSAEKKWFTFTASPERRRIEQSFRRDEASQ